MAGVVHITEAEAARDFAAVIDRALAGDEVVVRRGGEDVVVMSPVAKRIGRPLGEVIDALKDLNDGRGLTMPDEDFAADVAAAREAWAMPVDTIRGKTAEEVIRAFAQWEEEHGRLTVDDKFAEDVMDGHRILNQPMDDSGWG